MKAENEFAAGKHGIGFVGSYFESQFKGAEFEPVSIAPTFQKLPRRMNDAKIESELKPGHCTLGDVLAFIDNAPQGCKDGWANLFYFPSCVVSVRWYGGEWYVYAWRRDASGWCAENRVFSPHPDRGTQELVSSPSIPETLESLTKRVSALEQAIVRLLGTQKKKPKKTKIKNAKRKR